MFWPGQANLTRKKATDLKHNVNETHHRAEDLLKHIQSIVGKIKGMGPFQCVNLVVKFCYVHLSALIQGDSGRGDPGNGVQLHHRAHAYKCDLYVDPYRTMQTWDDHANSTHTDGVRWIDTHLIIYSLTCLSFHLTALLIYLMPREIFCKSQ